jgi:hypothetical protein
MENEAQAKILQLLDVISIAVAANRGDTAALRNETGKYEARCAPNSIAWSVDSEILNYALRM